MNCLYANMRPFDKKSVESLVFSWPLKPMGLFIFLEVGIVFSCRTVALRKNFCWQTNCSSPEKVMYTDLTVNKKNSGDIEICIYLDFKKYCFLMFFEIKCMNKVNFVPACILSIYRLGWILSKYPLGCILNSYPVDCILSSYDP